VLVFLDQHTGFASHKFSLLLRGGAWYPKPILGASAETLQIHSSQNAG